MDSPILIPVDDWRTFRIDEKGGQARLQIQVTGGGGMLFRIEPNCVHAIIEALEGLECMQGKPQAEPRYPQDVKTYRKWFFWTAQIGDTWYPKVDNPDEIDQPVTLPICPSEESAVQACKAWIDKQYVPEDDAGVIG